MAALPGQVLPMNQRARRSAALKREPRVDERGGPGVVVDKKRLGYNPLRQWSGQHAAHARTYGSADLGHGVVGKLRTLGWSSESRFLTISSPSIKTGWTRKRHF